MPNTDRLSIVSVFLVNSQVKIPNHQSKQQTIYNMSSFIETNDQALDYGCINPKVKEAPKGFAFFVYFQRSQHDTHNHNLQKMVFTMREEKAFNPDKQEHGRLINLHFTDLDNEAELEQSFFQLKITLADNPKTKLIFYTQEQPFLGVLHRAKLFGIDLSHVSSALYSPDLHQDLAQHLGWKQSLLGDLSLKSSIEFQQNVKKWISSPGERIDMWSALIEVDPQQGVIHRLDPLTNTFVPIEETQLQQHFISHLCLGHHAQLTANYQANRKKHSHSILNKLIFSLQSTKKFCCIGTPSLQASTGIVSIFFQDDKGKNRQINKQLVKQGSKRGIMSLLFSNIDKFQGMRLKGGRLNDCKLQMGVCESSKQFRLIESIKGDVVVRLDAPELFVCIGNTCLRLLRPRQLKVSHWGKVKLLISKQTLEC